MKSWEKPNSFLYSTLMPFPKYPLFLSFVYLLMEKLAKYQERFGEKLRQAVFCQSNSQERGKETRAVEASGWISYNTYMTPEVSHDISGEVVRFGLFELGPDLEFQAELGNLVGLAPKYLKREKVLSLKGKLEGKNPQEAAEARQKLISYCLPQISAALEPLWGGRYGLADRDLFLIAFQKADSLISSWKDEWYFRMWVSGRRIQERVEVDIVKAYGLQGRKRYLPIIELFWRSVKDHYRWHGQLPPLEEVKNLMEKEGLEKRLDLEALVLNGWERQVDVITFIYQQVVQEPLFVVDRLREELSLVELLGFESLLREEIRTLLSNCLVERERRVIELWMEDQAVEFIAGEMGVTRERVRQILDKALRKLKHFKYKLS